MCDGKVYNNKDENTLCIMRGKSHIFEFNETRFKGVYNMVCFNR